MSILTKADIFKITVNISIMDNLKNILLLVGEFVLVLVCCYLIAVIFTLFAVATGGVAVDDMSVWSEHIRNLFGILNSSVAMLIIK